MTDNERLFGPMRRSTLDEEPSSSDRKHDQMDAMRYALQAGTIKCDKCGAEASYRDQCIGWCGACGADIAHLVPEGEPI